MHGDRGMFIFPVQLTTSRIGNLTRLIHTLIYVMTIHTYIHTYVDDILVSGEKETCDELHHTLNENFPTENIGELKWYLGCAVERDWQQGSVTIK